MHGKRRSSTFLAALVGVAMLLTGCGLSSHTDATGVPVAGGTLVDLQNFAGGDPDHIDPALANDIPSSQIAALLYDGLTKVDVNGKTRPAVAEEISVSEDAKSWTFRLRDDVKFNNGDLVRPSDFKFAWERVFASELGSTLTSQFDIIEGSSDASATGSLSGVSANDEARTLTVKLRQPYREFLSQVSLPVFSPLPKRVFDVTPALRTDWENTAMVGNGAFKMQSSWEHGKRIVLLRNDTYYGGPDEQKAYVNEIEFRISKDLASAYTDFQAGNADVGRIPAGQYKDAHKQYSNNVVNPPLMGTEYWGFNLDNPVVGGADNEPLREAVALAVDKGDIVDKIYNGAREPAKSWAPPSTPGYEARNASDASDANPERAKQLLQEWGKTPPSLKVSFNTGAGHEEKAAIIVQNLNDVGIPAVIDPLDLDTYRKAVGTGTLEFFRGTWNADFASYDNMLQPLFHSDSIGGQNVFGYRSNRFDELVDNARAEKDESKREQLYRQAETQLLSDQVIVPIDWTTASLVESNRLRNLEVLPLGHVAYDKAWIAA